MPITFPETWTYEGDTKATVTGRTRVSIWKKLNPVWWFQNDYEENITPLGTPGGTTDWYMPEASERKRWWFWQFRNPFQNLRAMVLGVADKNYTVIGRAPVMTVQRDDLGEKWGLQWHLLYGGDLWVPRFFFCWSGLGDIYFGWQPTGFFGAKCVGIYPWAIGFLIAGLVYWRW